MKKSTHLLASIALLALLGGCSKSPEEKYARAQESYAQNDFAAARLDLISALDDDPQNAAMLELLAKAQIAMGDGEGAAASLAKLANANAGTKHRLLLAEADILRGRFDDALKAVASIDLAEAKRIGGLAQMGKGDPAAARSWFVQGMEAPGPKARLYAAFARLELGSGKIEAARKLAEKSIAQKPAPLDGMLVAADIGAAQNRLSDALTLYNQALASYPANFAASIGKVAVLGDLDRFDEAEKLLGSFAGDAPDNPRVIYLQARIASAKGQWEKARTILQSQEILMRDNPSMQVVYAEALLRICQIEQSRGWLGPLLRKYPSNRKVRRLLGEAQLAGGDAQGALATLQPIADRPDASPEELALAAKAAKASGDMNHARYSQRAKLPAPEWLGGELAKGDTALRNGNWAAAARSYQAIVDRSPQPNGMVLNNLAFAKANLGQKDEALQIALKALSASPEHPSVMDTAGWLLVETGRDRQRGVALLKAAARKAPDNAAIARHLTAATAN